jgi:hypothetical protein
MSRGAELQGNYDGASSPHSSSSLLVLSPACQMLVPHPRQNVAPAVKGAPNPFANTAPRSGCEENSSSPMFFCSAARYELSMTIAVLKQRT